MSKAITIIGLIILGVGCTNGAFAQSDTTDTIGTPQLGIAANGLWNEHKASFAALPGIPTGRPNDGVLFTGGQGIGWSASAIFEYPVLDVLNLGIRLSYADNSGILRAQEHQRIGFLTSDGSAVHFYDAVFHREINARLAMVHVEPILCFYPFAGAYAAQGLRLYAGAHVGAMMRTTFTQQEVIAHLTPADALANDVVFNTLQRIRNPIPEQHIPQAQALHTSVVAGVGYDIRAGALVLSPEASYTLGLTPVADNITWRVHQARVGLGVRYVFPPPPPPPPPPPLKPIAAVEATVAAFTTDTSGVEVPLVQIKVEEFISRQMYPLLPYIFFDYNSSVIPARYHRLTSEEAVAFSETKFFNADAMQVYYDVLNIVGKRLQRYPKTTITIIGCNDNSTPGELGNLNLSRSRAEEVRQYIVRTFGIDTARMRIRERNLPEKPTNSRDSIGIEENRRVEIASDSWEIMQPVLVYDTMLVPSAPVVRFKTSAYAEAGVAKSTLRAFQGGRTLKQFTSLGALDPVVEWNTAREQSTVPRTEEKMQFSYEVIDTEGRVAMPVGAVDVEQVTIRKKRSLRMKDKEIDTYRLILFDFDSPEVGPENARIIKELVVPNVTKQSTVQVTGFTDKLGSAEVNQRLSEGRARSVANLVPSQQTTAKGFGARMIIYPNEIPEGRFLSRTVEVRVETPIEE
ncbi:MAG: OmpA family protein [Bacteroidota bacterium]|nr:OmpA family protein [Candidatus Kapabacteria bacterium]MDW8218903.1 OmpA family protein [Bacteroidota bacterium]